MTVALVTHPACAEYTLPPLYPDQPARLDAISDQLIASGLEPLLRGVEAAAATDDRITAVHAPEYLARLEHSLPQEGWTPLDGDTLLAPRSLAAARGAAGAALRAMELTLAGEVEAAFALTRPPGHHAGRASARGFCLLNHAALAARHALRHPGTDRVAIVDFDAHHGDGTESLVWEEPGLLFLSLFQEGGFGAPSGTGPGNAVRLPLPPRATGRELRALARQRLLPALEGFRPDLLLFSAGFDGHAEEDLADLRLLERDYAWLVRACRAAAGADGPPPTALVLEGGYVPRVLGRCVTEVVRALLGPA
ncbi:MAG: histone deacetylase family protein [Thiohalorhabdus sp.]|uniref:histone deacetylase family protein n=1 Tax=Thiohalorhabdus sp. TaxID=3094134 RepID=UPI00397F96F7